MEKKTIRSRQHYLFTRRCVSCGFDSQVLQEYTFICPNCGCDLQERPPRSYAEMEDLIGEPLPELFEPWTMPQTAQPNRFSNLIERWLLFVFLSLLLIFAIAALASAAVQP